MVLLLEAGVEELEMHMSNIPSSAFELQRSQFDWSFLTVPQRHSCKGLENQVCLGEVFDRGHESMPVVQQLKAGDHIMELYLMTDQR